MTNTEDDTYICWAIEVLKKCRRGSIPSERDMHNLEYAVEIVDEMYENSHVDSSALDESF